MDREQKMKDPDGTGDPLVRAVTEQGGPQGKATCSKTGEDMKTQVSPAGTATGKEEEGEKKEGWRERKKQKRKEKRRAAVEGQAGISPLHRRCAPELGEGFPAGERRGKELAKAAQTHAGGSAGGGGRSGATPSRTSRWEMAKRKRQETGNTPEMRPIRRQKQSGEEEQTYAQAARERRQVAIVAKGGGTFLSREQADEIRARLRIAVKRYHGDQKIVKPMAQSRVYLKFRDAGWMPPGFLLVTCHDQFTEEWLARWDPGELNGEPLEVALGSNIPWPRKICVVIKDEVEPDPEVVRETIEEQNNVEAEVWKAQGVEELKDNDGEEERKRWLLTYMVPATALAKLQAQEMELFYELIAIRAFRPRGRRGKTYLAGKKEEERTQTETGESGSDSESS